MIEPNRLFAPGEARARARVEEVFERIDELGMELLALPVPLLDLAQRAADIADLEDDAARHGRSELLDEARTRLREGLMRRVVARNVPVGYGQALVSGGSVDDQVARAMAIDDAVSVAVVEDVLDAETAARLSAPGLRLLGLAPAREEDVEEATAAAPRGDGEQTGEADAPAARDVVADQVMDEVADDEVEEELADDELEDPRETLRQRRAVLFVGVGAIALPIAYANGMGLPGLLLIVAALVLIAWLFADA